MSTATAEQFEAWALAQARTFFSRDGRLATRAFALLRSGARFELMLPDTRAARAVVAAGYRAALAERYDAAAFVVVAEQYSALEAWCEHPALDGGAARRWRCPLLRGEGAGLAAGHWEREGRAP